MEASRRRYGDAFSVRFLGFERPLVLLSDPRAVQALYSSAEHGLPPGRALALLPMMGPSSVLLLEGRAHLERRRLMLPAFHGERMRAYEPLIDEIVAAEVARWPRDQPFAIHRRMQAITLEVILRAVFGVTDRGRAQRLRELLPRLLDATASAALSFRVLLARRLRRPNPLERFAPFIGEIDTLLADEIAARRTGQNDARDDILSLLLAARFEDGSAMSDRELRDQLMTLLLAGHETTATALAWTFDLVLHDRDVMARLERELRHRGDDAYLRAVIAESLRLRPVLPLAGRRLAHALEVDGVQLAPGTDVTPAIWLIHTRADLYPQPLRFRPERFLEAPAPPYAWIPFGGGVRRCLGAAFAELEMRGVLAGVLSRVKLSPADPRGEAVMRRNITFSPRHGTRVRARSRAGTGQTSTVQRSPRRSSSSSTRGRAAAVRRHEPSAE